MANGVSSATKQTREWNDSFTIWKNYKDNPEFFRQGNNIFRIRPK